MAEYQTNVVHDVWWRRYHLGSQGRVHSIYSDGRYTHFLLQNKANRNSYTLLSVVYIISDWANCAEKRETSSNQNVFNSKTRYRIMDTNMVTRFQGFHKPSMYRWEPHCAEDWRHCQSNAMEEVCVLISCVGSVQNGIIYVNSADIGYLERN